MRTSGTDGQLVPHPQSLRREEIPGCGGFLRRRRSPGPLPLDTLVFFVTCFSFCFSSLVPFFQGHFHFRLSVSPPPHPHPSFLCPHFPPTALGSPESWPAEAWGSGLGWGSGMGRGRPPVPSPTAAKGRRLSHRPERPGRGHPSPGSQLSFSGPQAPHL